MRARLWVVIPTYNEAVNVERIVRAVDAELDRIVPGDHRILVVDDKSPDGTGAIADALAAELPTVEVLHRPVKDGLGHAYRAGFSHALAAGADGVLVTASTKSSELMHQAAEMCRKRGRIVLTGVVGLELRRSDFYDKELSFRVSRSYGPGRALSRMRPTS